MKYMTKQEVAEKLHVTVRTITTYSKNGLLPPPRQLGRRLLWLESELDNRILGMASMVPVAVAPSKRPGRPRKVAF
ncbi:helix-turn-helix domain-containing protein [Duganella sp. FT134W]|uniref:Helix-turn-helix domain-containing protein n=2 Tax=Duganella margarita TaxID=2692170 RepID=A0A7X4GXQ8_9BURK|nr:helix-turn-helix domain-containing protein [Duganella margarita]